MRFEIERRLHRVKIYLEKKDVKCPYSTQCDSAENCDRCNTFFNKCAIYQQNYIKKKKETKN